MSKFPNQLALVSLVGVSAIALAVGLDERARTRAAETAHADAMHRAEAVAVATDAVEEQAITTEAVAEVAAEAEQAAEAEVAAAEPIDTPDAAETAASAVAVADGATDTLNGQGDTDTVAGDDTAAPHGKFGLGRPALAEEVAAWNLDIMPDGRGLPDGEGSVEDGEMVFSDNCAVCHGEFAEGVDNWPKLAGGMDTLDRQDPLKTVGSYWPYLSTTFDYVRRSMPFGAAQTMSDDDVYAMVAYILYSNDLVEDDFVLSKETFLEVEMPNADGFILDDRAETELEQFSQDPCMENCKDAVEITMRAAVLDVTPDHGVSVEGEAMEGMEAAAETGTDAEAGEPAAEASEVAAVAEAPAETVAEAAPASDAAALDPELVAAGETVFKKCKACHQVGEDAKNKVGPVLNGVVGRQAGTAPDFKYSNVVIEAGEGGLVWTSETLHEYLANPKSYLKGNKMSFAGLKKPEDVDAVVAYLQSHP